MNFSIILAKIISKFKINATSSVLLIEGYSYCTTIRFVSLRQSCWYKNIKIKSLDTKVL